MTKKNEQLQEAYDYFVSENKKYKELSKMIWRAIFFKAGDSFLTMNKEERDQFFGTKIVHNDLVPGTRTQYRHAYDNIVDVIDGRPRKVIDKCECNNKTKLVHEPRNKNSRTNDIIQEELDKRISELEESTNSTKQKMEELNNSTKQKMEEFKNKLSQEEFQLANLKEAKRLLNMS